MAIERPVTIESVSAVTLGTRDMARAVDFYRSLGFQLHSGGDDSALTTFHVGGTSVNLISVDQGFETSWWGRLIFHVSDVDAIHRRAVELGFEPEDFPRDAPWGERFFHLVDPDGHELSFARRL